MAYLSFVFFRLQQVFLDPGVRAPLKTCSSYGGTHSQTGYYQFHKFTQKNAHPVLPIHKLVEPLMELSANCLKRYIYRIEKNATSKKMPRPACKKVNQLLVEVHLLLRRNEKVLSLVTFLNSINWNSERNSLFIGNQEKQLHAEQFCTTSLTTHFVQ